MVIYSRQANRKRFRAESGDVAVSEKILTAPKNARYLHYEIQNEIIHICGDQIINVLLKQINDSEYFSVLADETTDISGIEQLNICIRYYQGRILKTLVGGYGPYPRVKMLIVYLTLPTSGQDCDVMGNTNTFDDVNSINI